VRYSHDDRYFMTAKHQGIPVNGYGKIVENMLSNENIEVKLGVDFISIMDSIPEDKPILYCGQVDELLDYELGVLPYRSLRFEAEWVNEDEEDGADSKLGHAVINEADADVAYTRTHFYKYYQIHEPEVLASKKSYTVREYPADFVRGGEAYYPINNAENEELYERYVELLHERYPNITLGGRLGAYRYWDMDKAIRFALDYAETLEF
jgi:UDP-galactopyranose mutase